MKDTEKRLKEALSGIFNGHGQRLKMMSKLVLTVLDTCMVNYAQFALVINVKVKIESNFKRIQRFMRGYSFCQRQYVQFAWSLYGTQGKWIWLSMDRNNWKFGGTAIPLVWMMLNKRGLSNQNERILYCAITGFVHFHFGLSYFQYLTIVGCRITALKSICTKPNVDEYNSWNACSVVSILSRRAHSLLAGRQRI